MLQFHLLHLLATFGFCVLLWSVQLVIYPQMSRLREEDFLKYHSHHTWGISCLVGPLFLMESFGAICSFVLFWRLDAWGQAISLFLYGANTLLTALWFAPAHSQLSKGRNEGLVKQLITMNAWRTLLSTLRVVVVYHMVVRELS